MKSIRLSILAFAVVAWFFVDLDNAIAQKEDRGAPKQEFSALGADLAHGNRQVKQMLIDRPLMSRYVSNDTIVEFKSDNPIWTWAATAYGTEVNNLPIEWDASEPANSYAEHTIPCEGNCGLIRVRKRHRHRDGVVRDAIFERLWSGCIYELFNVQNAHRFLQIHKWAAKGMMTRQEYAKSNAMLEHRAVLKLVVFYDSVWKPWADANGYDTDPKLWFCGTPQKYDDWILRYRETKYTPESIWEEYYDQYYVSQLQ